jgi:hypothetical protein
VAVRLSALRAGRSLPPGRFLVLISVKRLSRPQDPSAAGWITSIEKNPLISLGIEPATIQLVDRGSPNYSTASFSKPRTICVGPIARGHPTSENLKTDFARFFRLKRKFMNMRMQTRVYRYVEMWEALFYLNMTRGSDASSKRSMYNATTKLHTNRAKIPKGRRLIIYNSLPSQHVLRKCLLCMYRKWEFWKHSKEDFLFWCTNSRWKWGLVGVGGTVLGETHLFCNFVFCQLQKKKELSIICNANSVLMPHLARCCLSEEIGLQPARYWILLPQCEVVLAYSLEHTFQKQMSVKPAARHGNSSWMLLLSNVTIRNVLLK